MCAALISNKNLKLGGLAAPSAKLVVAIGLQRPKEKSKAQKENSNQQSNSENYTHLECEVSETIINQI